MIRLNARGLRLGLLMLPCMASLSTGTVAQESIDLESTFLGDREQPSVSYFIPWKPTEGPENLYRAITSVSGQVFEPVDRDIHARTLRFYDELSLEAHTPGTGQDQH
ncbi:hypothetical protein [Marinobacter sp.]|uniref:hypothetical protein n=1 Tax=Marinobacter sp. TaxID=50741 RepID=UPI001A08972C|nr:hypothetical protein [Marinobacter sp.]MBE0486582.1 hypothetical protein [Marinobacter sp.]